MSTRDHHCPRCEKDWHCIGCHTRDDERLCDTCQEQEDRWQEIVKKVFENFQCPMDEEKVRQGAIQAYFAVAGCTVDFVSGEIKDSVTGKVRAQLHDYKMNSEGQLECHVQIHRAISYIPITVSVGKAA